MLLSDKLLESNIFLLQHGNVTISWLSNFVLMNNWYRPWLLIKNRENLSEEKIISHVGGFA